MTEGWKEALKKKDYMKLPWTDDDIVEYYSTVAKYWDIQVSCKDQEQYWALEAIKVGVQWPALLCGWQRKYQRTIIHTQEGLVAVPTPYYHWPFFPCKLDVFNHSPFLRTDIDQGFRRVDVIKIFRAMEAGKNE